MRHQPATHNIVFKFKIREILISEYSAKDFVYLA